MYIDTINELVNQLSVKINYFPQRYKDVISFYCIHCNNPTPVRRTVQTILDSKDFRCNTCAYANNNNKLHDPHESKTFVKLQKLLPTVSEPHYVKIGNNFILFVTYNDKLYRATNLIRATKNRV